MADFNLYLVLPVAALALYGILILLFAPLFRGNSAYLGPIALIGLVPTAHITLNLWRAWRESGAMETAAGMVRVDGFGLFFSMILLVIGALSILASMRFLGREGADHGEFYALLLFALAGMLAMIHTTHLIMVLIGLEVFSLSLYVMTGLTRGRPRSVEAALKYFLMGAFSSGFMVYGMALLYGAAGSLDMRRIAAIAAADAGPLLWFGIGMVLVGLAFKVGAVPFHQWVPDVYEGAPTNVTGFMAAATKTAAFAVLLRLLPGALAQHTEVWVPLVSVLAVLTMTVANLIALAQRNVKRLLAFSSIAHAGYLLIALVCRPDKATSAIVFYLAAYALMTVGAFVVAGAVGRGDATGEEGYDYRSWHGLGSRRPALAAAMTIFLLSLAGIPPLGGFVGKYVIFEAAIVSGKYTLAIIGGLNAVVAAYYYLQLIITMWMREPQEEPLFQRVSLTTALALIVAVVGVIYLGVLPDRVLTLARGLFAMLV